jgi:hypothetical protein
MGGKREAAVTTVGQHIRCEKGNGGGEVKALKLQTITESRSKQSHAW